MRLSETVLKEDVDEAMRLYREALKQSIMDPRTGAIDISILVRFLNVAIGMTLGQKSLGKLFFRSIFSASKKILPKKIFLKNFKGLKSRGGFGMKVLCVPEF